MWAVFRLILILDETVESGFHPSFAFAYDTPGNALGKYAVQISISYKFIWICKQRHLTQFAKRFETVLSGNRIISAVCLLPDP